MTRSLSISTLATLTVALAVTSPTARAAPAHPPDDLLDRVFRVEHRIAVGPGRRVAVTETFTLRALHRWPHRGIVMIPSQGANRSNFNAPFAGYDGGELMARAGFFAFAVDPEGSGDSTYPADGFSVTYESEAASLHAVAARLATMRHIERLDVLGEEVGGGVAAHLCADAALFRSCTLASMIYRDGSDFFDAIVGGPGFQQFIASSPGGYFTTFSELYFNVLAGATPELAAWFLATQNGVYAAGPYVQDFERLFAGGGSYDPTRAAVPGLVIMGELDPNPAPGDTAALAAAYGATTGAGPAEVAIIPGGTHIARLDAPPGGSQFWSLVLAFVDP